MSEGIFKVGDICEGKNFIFFAEYNGMECEIIQPFGSYAVIGHQSLNSGIMHGCYEVRWANGHEHFIMHKHLKKRKPPAPYKDFDTVVPWDTMPWFPKDLEVLA